MAISKEQEADIHASRSTLTPTRRVTVAALEDILYSALPVLDHGFVRVIDYMGDDRAIVQAARVSYGAGTKHVSQDKGLISYLMRHQHTSPFEMCEIKLHVKLPIFIARQWIRHRTANVNEYSARYSILDKEFYLPEPHHIAAQSTINNQGRGEVLDPQESHAVLELLRRDAEMCYETYEHLLNEQDGEPVDPQRHPLARELARMNLTLNYYTQWYWKIDLHNLLHFIRLRADHHAQYEIQAYANVLSEIVERWVPLTHGAFQAYRVGGVTLSEGGLEAVRKLLRKEPVTRQDVGLSAREWQELMDSLKS